MTFKKQPLARAARLQIILPAIAGSLLAYSAAMAQSTGSQVEAPEVVVTGAHQQTTNGLAVISTAAKDQSIVTQRFIQTQVGSANFCRVTCGFMASLASTFRSPSMARRSTTLAITRSSQANTLPRKSSTT